MNKRQELKEMAQELGGLPMDIATIIDLETNGWIVDLVTGEIRRDEYRFSLTPSGEALATIIKTGFLDD